MRNSEVPRPDVRQCWRSSVLLAALLSSPAGLQTVRIRNISPTGAMLGGDRFPREGTRVTLRRGDLRETGCITWRRAGLAGVTFDREVDVDAWMEHNERPAARQADLDNGGNLPASATDLEAESSQVTFAWVSSRLAEISDRLANSAPMRVELAEVLGEIDALAKFLRIGGDPAAMRAVQDNGPAKHG